MLTTFFLLLILFMRSPAKARTNIQRTKSPTGLPEIVFLLFQKLSDKQNKIISLYKTIISPK